MRVRAWVLVVWAMLAAGPAAADWRFEYRSSPDPRYDRLYRYADPRHNRLYPYARPYYAQPRIVQRCHVDLVPGPWGYTEVTRCRPAGRQARPPGLYLRID